jgi:hypothetical protein
VRGLVRVRTEAKRRRGIGELITDESDCNTTVEEIDLELAEAHHGVGAEVYMAERFHPAPRVLGLPWAILTYLSLYSFSAWL